MNSDKRFAILIDGDNISADYIRIILDEISNRGVATYKRIYGDWTKPNLGKWKDVLLEFSITPIQQYGYTYGKNATDSALIIDAMDILYTEKVDGFCLVSSDSDFTKLASRLRESGMTVIGMGEAKTPRPFIAACNEFKYVDRLMSEKLQADKEATAEKAQETVKVKSKKEPLKKEKNPEKEPETTREPEPVKTSTSQTSLSTLREAISQMIDDYDGDDDEGFVPVSTIGDILSKRYPDFDVRNYGYKKMVSMLEAMGRFEIKKTPDPLNKRNPNAQLAYVRLKPRIS